MSDNLKINTRVRRLFHYIDDFQRGNIQVPAFQRDHIWEIKAKIELFESIKLGYPIGSILFWRPDFKSEEDFLKFEADKIGSYFLPERTQDYYYILDGYQRLSTFFGCLVNPHKTNLKRDNEEWQKDFNLIYNLETDEFEYNRKSNLNDLEIFKVPLFKFIDGKEFFEFQKQLLALGLDNSTINNYIKKYEHLSSNIIDYNIPSIDMIGGSIKEAVDIFSRVNSKGAKITDDWKVSALSFNKERDFRLGTEIDNLLKDLKKYNFHNIKRELIFDCIKNSFGKAFFDQVKNSKELENLAARIEFIDVTRKTLASIEKSIKFLFEECVVIDGKLLPYSIQLIFITDFFNKVKTPTQNQLYRLKDWFWVTSFMNYFTSNLTQQRLAYNQFQKFINDENEIPIYFDSPKNKLSVSRLLPKINMKGVRAKSTALFMLNRFKKILNVEVLKSTGFKMYNLFSEIGENSDVNIIENTIIIIDNQFVKEKFDITSATKELSYLLEQEENKDYDAFFITAQMKILYSQNRDKNEILQLRKRAIEIAEKEFVEILGLGYDFS